MGKGKSSGWLPTTEPSSKEAAAAEVSYPEVAISEDQQAAFLLANEKAEGGVYGPVAVEGTPGVYLVLLDARNFHGASERNLRHVVNTGGKTLPLRMPDGTLAPVSILGSETEKGWEGHMRETFPAATDADLKALRKGTMTMPDFVEKYGGRNHGPADGVARRTTRSAR